MSNLRKELKNLIERYRTVNFFSGDDRADIEHMRTLADVANELEELLEKTDD